MRAVLSIRWLLAARASRSPLIERSSTVTAAYPASDSWSYRASSTRIILVYSSHSEDPRNFYTFEGTKRVPQISPKRAALGLARRSIVSRSTENSPNFWL